MPAVLVDLRDAGLGSLEAARRRLRIGATVTLAELARRAAARARTRRSRQAASLAASPLLRNAGHGRREPLPAHALLVLPRARSGTAGSAAARRATRRSATIAKHNLEPGDCISAHPSDLAPALAACGATVELRVRGRRSRAAAARRSTGGRRRTTARSSRSRGASSSPPSRCRPRPTRRRTSGSASGRAFTFPLVSVAAARRDDTARLVAAGVANVPRELDPADPLAGLPGNPQTAWKRTLLATLAGRALDRIR